MVEQYTQYNNFDNGDCCLKTTRCGRGDLSSSNPILDQYFIRICGGMWCQMDVDRILVHDIELERTAANCYNVSDLFHLYGNVTVINILKG